MERYLITTADQRTWKFDRPVLFLGEWCRLYNARGVWSKMDAVVAEPFGIQIDKKDDHDAYIKSLLPEFMAELTDMLNAYHHSSHGMRYWKMLVGPWLRQFVEVAFNRYFSLQAALNHHRISGTAVYQFENYSLATVDTLSFEMGCDDIWNNIFYAKILNYWGRGDVDIDIDTLPLPRGGGVTVCPTIQSRRGRTPETLKGHLLQWFKKMAPMFSRKHDAFIINSYLNTIMDIRLQFSLRQFPQLWDKPMLQPISPDPFERGKLLMDMSRGKGFEHFVRMMIPEAIPTCFVEGYESLQKQVNEQAWPTAPRFIFTSNSYFMDEVFKAYAAAHVEKMVPYYVGAHGSFGVSPHIESDNNSPENETADKHFTWGWVDENPKNIPAFNFKTCGLKVRQEVSDGGLLLIQFVLLNRVYHWDTVFEHGLYQEGTFRFVEYLPDVIQQQLTVRLHSGFRSTGWCDDKRWQDRCPQVRVEHGRKKIRNLIARSRLVVHSYDSTGILETLTLNVPTICFWPGGLDHLYPRAKKYYQILMDAGILLDSPEHAASQVTQHWDDIAGWWSSSKVQSARKGFCKHLSRTVDDPVKTMKCLLTENGEP